MVNGVNCQNLEITKLHIDADARTEGGINVKLEFFHGRLIGGFEQIANEEGKTFGDDAELFEDIAHAHNILKFNGYLTEAQADAICQKLQAQLDSSIKPLKEEK